MGTQGSEGRREGEWLKGWCAMCLENCCGMLVRVKDGVVLETVGDRSEERRVGKECHSVC